VNQSILSILTLALCLSGCTVSEKHSAAKSAAIRLSAGDADLANVSEQKTNDPWQGLNRTTFGFNDGLNTYASRPVAHGYAAIVPLRVRNGVTNFFDNLNYPVRFINSVLQGKITRSAQETGKFVINTTAGVGGLIRVSDHISSLADVPAEDFGQTLGVWGIAPGPYILIPVLGPSDCRDLVGFAGDFVMSPLNWHTIGLIHYAFITDPLTIALSTTRYVNGLPKAIDSYDQLKSEAVDPYVAMRDAYLSYRAAQVKK
jgi:phospholipid-binding lipoprotein MlaA